MASIPQRHNVTAYSAGPDNAASIPLNGCRCGAGNRSHINKICNPTASNVSE